MLLVKTLSFQDWELLSSFTTEVVTSHLAWEHTYVALTCQLGVRACETTLFLSLRHQETEVEFCLSLEEFNVFLIMQMKLAGFCLMLVYLLP
jgi:hypothetical protein